MGTARTFRVTLNGGVRTRLLVLLLGFGASACANGGGGNSGAPSGGDDGGGDATSDAPAKGDAHGDAPAGDGGSSTTAQKACDDNATTYCTQLEKCAPFLVTAQYGDVLTCEQRVPIGCLDSLQSQGTGWTGDNLEACIAARTALGCSDFLFGKPQPNACRVTGTITTSEACRYSQQCGTGYCRYASGASCGTCVTLGATGSPCTTSADCDGNLMCSTAGTCQPPSSAASLCNATTPCQQGLVCIGGACTAPGGLGATCAAANGGADCDYYQGVYCDTTSNTCKAYAQAQIGGTCGGFHPHGLRGQRHLLHELVHRSRRRRLQLQPAGRAELLLSFQLPGRGARRRDRRGRIVQHLLRLAVQVTRA